MNILDTIVTYKKKEVTKREHAVPITQLKQSTHFNRNSFSLYQSLLSKNGIIAEFKRKSPSHGNFLFTQSLEEIVESYTQADVSGISILTDFPSFGGSIDDIKQVRPITNLPILRKEFIISPYQMYEAKAIGADAILLIASILSRKDIEEFSQIATDIGLEVLLEIHSENELDKIPEKNIKLVGINHRNLDTLEIDLSLSEKILPLLNKEYLVIAESGLKSVEKIKDLKSKGIQGFLMGDYFVSTTHPGEKCKKLSQELEKVQ